MSGPVDESTKSVAEFLCGDFVYDLLDQLLNETVNSDSTYVAEMNGTTSFTSSSSLDSLSNFDSSIESENVSAIEWNISDIFDPNASTKSDEVTFVSTISGLTSEKTTDSLIFSEAIDFPGPIVSRSMENGKPPVNQYIDPTDVLIAKLAGFQINEDLN